MTTNGFVARDQGVAVGYDGSDLAARAVHWAAAAAGARGESLTVITTWDRRAMSRPRRPVPTTADTALAIAGAGVQIARGAGGPDAAVAPRVIEGRATDALVAVSGGYSLLVIGAQHEAARHGRLGEVAQECVRHTACPVALVGVVGEVTAPCRILLSWNEGDGDLPALRWTSRQLHPPLPVHLVLGWSPRLPMSWEPVGQMLREDRERARARFAVGLDQLRSTREDSLVSGELLEVRGTRPILPTRPDDLLVLGRSRAVTEHGAALATVGCPVLVVPPRAGAELPATPARRQPVRQPRRTIPRQVSAPVGAGTGSRP